jgi:hypothetical protein
MKTKYIASILTLLLFASVFTFGFTINKAFADDTTISIPSVSKTPSDLGNTFTVPVQISNVSDLFGFDIKITWNNTLITFLSLNNTPLNTVWPQEYFEPLAWVTPFTAVQSGSGYVRYSAVAKGGSGYTGEGPTTLFTITFTIVKAGNFPYSTSLHFDTVKLSDHDANTITATATDGPYSMSATVPDIDFALINPNPSKPYESGKYIEVEVNATHITSDLKGYDLKVDFTSDLLWFVKVQTWGVLGTGSVNTSTSGVVDVSISSGSSFTGEAIRLFTLTFNVTMDDSIRHIWNTSSSHTLPATVSLDGTTGSLDFVEGSLYVNGSGPTLITPPSTIHLTINLIQGDVAGEYGILDGKVDITDLRTIAAFYDTMVPPTDAKYDVKTDGTIDIFDLVVVATNFGYNKPDSPPT